MALVQTITPCLWFDGQAEQAADFYVSIFPDSRITDVSRYGDAGREQHGREPGSVMTVAFELDGQTFTALNGGPSFRFTPAISFQVNCDTQEQIDRYWSLLGEGGPAAAQQCGWLEDRFGVSWQIVPRRLPDLVKDPASPAAQRAIEAMMRMKKLDLAALEAAYRG